MNTRLVVVIALALAVTPVGAVTITVCGTGRDATCTATLALGANDPNYTLAGGTDVVVPPISGFWITDPDNQWIAPTADSVAPPGTYTYTTTFTLPAEFFSPTITLNFATDNPGTVALNGVVFGSSPSYTSYTTASTATGFVAGVNTLTFTVTNLGTSPNPTGLLVDTSSVTYELIPEPGTWSLMGGGLLAVMYGLRRRARRAKAKNHAAK